MWIRWAQNSQRRRKCEISPKAMHTCNFKSLETESLKAFFPFSLSLFNYFPWSSLSKEDDGEPKKPFREFIIHGLIFRVVKRENLNFLRSAMTPFATKESSMSTKTHRQLPKTEAGKNLGHGSSRYSPSQLIKNVNFCMLNRSPL